MIVLFAVIVGCTSTEITNERIMRGRLQEAGDTYMATLRSTLLREMKKGPDQAVIVCSDSARAIARMVEHRYGVEIRRTSQRYRNPLNAPTRADLQILEYFERQLTSGARPDTVVVFDSFETDGKRFRRLARPILLTSTLCLKCHGDERSMDGLTRAALTLKYPDDQAKGYAVGELRGALIVSAVIP